MRRIYHPLFATMMMIGGLSGCAEDTVTFNLLNIFGMFDDAEPEAQTVDVQEKKDDEDSKFISVIAEGTHVSVHPTALEGIVLSDAVRVDEWMQEGGGVMQPTKHIKGSRFQEVTRRATAGDGAQWIHAALAPSPIITPKSVIAMDGMGVVSAHSRRDIEESLWVSHVAQSDSALLTGGIAAADGRIYIATGRGVLASLDEKTGKKLWSRDLGEPLRSSVRIMDNRMYVVTADSRLLCLSPYNGSLLWEHQGVGDAKGLFGTSLPTILGNYVLIAYASGDFYMLDNNSGSMVWSDTLTRPRRTMATGLFAGVDANPVSDGRVIYAAATSGLFVADDARNGMRLWDIPVGTRHTPWMDDELLFMVSDRRELLGIARQRGQIGWKKPLPRVDEDDYAIRSYGPFLINHTLVTVMADGSIFRHDPLKGTRKNGSDLDESIASSPSFAGAYAYIITYDGDLLEVE
ncbi:MAG: hypothetical protein EAY65_06280 [Alphaproteobacteria bacterium]|nr:MAG: hypothetical protein EAY65_06280 [Alphaproteobacteria bacterium]